MSKHYVIGNMTGNSMDAIDLVLTEFDGNKMTDICSFSMPYSTDMQEKIDYLRDNVLGKTRQEIMQIPDFQEIHDEYVSQVAECVNEMCKKYKINKSKVSAIGFHGKTLDHNPPSKDEKAPYTLQIGSGQMLADLTGIPVVYDFRSKFIKNNLDGAPLVPPHNAHIAASEGAACFYNGGNTSNFAWIVENVKNKSAEPFEPIYGSDAGPCNEYIDKFIREKTKDSKGKPQYTFDENGKFGKDGVLDTELLQKMFDIGKKFYELRKENGKSGDPQFYHTDKVLALVKDVKFKDAKGNVTKEFKDALHTFEYFASYLAVYSLTQIQDFVDAELKARKLTLPNQILLFGGGWKNPIVFRAFKDLLAGKGYVLPEHKVQFKKFLKTFTKKPVVQYSAFGAMMEARLFADLARYKLLGKAWLTPDSKKVGKKIVCGRIAKPNKRRKNYTDCINEACCGWQKEVQNMKKLLNAKGKIR